MEFSKILLLIDYLFMAALIALACVFSGAGVDTIAVAWAAQLAISSGFYFWKARSENRIKVPVEVIKSLPKSMRGDIDLTQIIVSILEQGGDK